MDQGSPADAVPSTMRAMPSSPPVLPTLSRLRTACSQCNLRELCLPVGLSADELLQAGVEIESERYPR